MHDLETTHSPANQQAPHNLYPSPHLPAVCVPYAPWPVPQGPEAASLGCWPPEEPSKHALFSLVNYR